MINRKMTLESRIARLEKFLNRNGRRTRKFENAGNFLKDVETAVKNTIDTSYYNVSVYAGSVIVDVDEGDPEDEYAIGGRYEVSANGGSYTVKSLDGENELIHVVGKAKSLSDVGDLIQDDLYRQAEDL